MLVNREWLSGKSNNFITWGYVKGDKVFVGEDCISFVSDVWHIGLKDGDKVLVAVEGGEDGIRRVLSGKTERVLIVMDWIRKAAMDVSTNASVFEGARIYCQGKAEGVLICDIPVEALTSYFRGFDLSIPDESIVVRGSLEYGDWTSVVAGRTDMNRIKTLNGATFELPEFEMMGVEELVYIEGGTYKGNRIPYSENTEMAELQFYATGEVTQVPETQVSVVLWGVEDGDLVTVKIPEELFAYSGDVTYYPYLWDGTVLFTVDKKKSQSTLPVEASPALRGEIVYKRDEYGSLGDLIRAEIDYSVREYEELIYEVLRDAPPAYRESEKPILSALRWALAKEKGRL